MNHDPTVGDPGYAALAGDLRDAGIDTLFGVMGEANLDLIACLSGRHGIRYVAARHEAGAVAMADGYARSSGRIGVATVTCGPGLTNAITPLVTAVRARAEVLLVTGQLPLSTVGRSQTIDHRALLAPTGAGIVHVETADELPGALERALRIIRETHAPAVLNILMPVLDGPASSSAPAPMPATPRVSEDAVSDAAIQEAAALLGGAARPVILAGRGAVEARLGPRLAALAERLDAGLAVSLLAHSLFAGHPRDLGVAGGLSSAASQDALASADVIAVFGASLNGWTTRAGTAGRQARIVQVDRDPQAFARATVPVEIELVGDAAAILDRLLPALGEARASSPPRPKVEPPPGSGPKLDPRALCRVFDAALPPTRTVTVDAGQFFEFPTRYLGVPDPQGYLFTIAFGTVGLGLATATGAAIARPDRVSVACIGDGGVMMSLVDLDVIARERLPMLILVFNDEAYGAEIKHLDDRGWNADLARFRNPDFAALARTIGIEGVTVRTLDEARALAPRLAGLAGPLLVDARIDPDVKAEWMAVMHAARQPGPV